MPIHTTNLVDYPSLPLHGPNGRRFTAVKSLMDAGMAKNKAVSIVAVSQIECCGSWSQSRETDMIFDQTPCWTMRQGVSLERPSNDAPASVKVMYSSGMKDPDALAYLQSRGLATLTQFGLAATDKLLPPNNWCGTNTTEVARWLEWTIMNRKANLLQNFSVGPTMIWLAESGPGVQAGLTPNMGCSFPATWDDIFNLYMAQVPIAAGNAINYLDPPCYGHFPGYPADIAPTGQTTDPSVEGPITDWLVNHVGNKAGAVNYYGVFPGGYIGNLWGVIQDTKNL